ncbi:hypothetical protein [Sphingomonas prati]|uniref:Preprotein translocase subunit YajC n=1 Tax=Sphingomonas prati TaxID=1843237 RepID=A0A7W9F1J4_9SPHN|nr:hypothetical protein [Sphingomonas prati]MBB5729542.1 preprotein translocase subunit YajC [Sphingomonas prati]GGE76641.1 hypothetical protein GCM10011404_06630 [Sphingomonas prati]
MKSILIFAGLATLATGAQAQTTAAPAAGSTTTATAPAGTSAATSVKAGATVTDTTGGTVGTIKSIEGDLAVLSTGTVEVRLPLTSFAAGANGPVIALTKSQVESAASSATAERQGKLSAQIKAGTTVLDASGGTVGKIESVDGEFATVATTKNKVKLPVSSFAAGANGPVIGMTAAELDAAAAKAAPAAAAATTGN